MLVFVVGTKIKKTAKTIHKMREKHYFCGNKQIDLT
jgi:hypothetical protein